MGKIKTVDTGGKLVSFRGSLRLLGAEKNNEQRVEVRLLNSEVNRNNWKYLNLEAHRKLFANTPILVAYKGRQVGDGHNFDEIRNPDGTVTASFMSATAERIVGCFRSEADIRIETIDNKQWIVGVGYIWKWYAQELVAKLRGEGREDGEMSVSIETLIEEMHMEGSTEVYTRYQILGTTILGDDVDPAVAGASIRALSAIGTAGIREMTLRVASANPQAADGNENKSRKDRKHMNAKKIKEIEAKFPGYRFLAANGANIALLSADGYFALASYKEENGEILPGAKTDVEACLMLGEGEGAVKVNYAELRKEDADKIASLETKLADAESGRDSALKTLEDMRKHETERRKEACKNAIENCFNEYKESCDAAFDEGFCSEFLTDEKLDEYAKAEKDGKFCGDEDARRDVAAKCAEAIKKAAKEKKARENAKKVYAWDEGGEQPADGINAMIASFMND